MITTTFKLSDQLITALNDQIDWYVQPELIVRFENLEVSEYGTFPGPDSTFSLDVLSATQPNTTISQDGGAVGPFIGDTSFGPCAGDVAASIIEERVHEALLRDQMTITNVGVDEPGNLHFYIEPVHTLTNGWGTGELRCSVCGIYPECVEYDDEGTDAPTISAEFQAAVLVQIALGVPAEIVAEFQDFQADGDGGFYSGPDSVVIVRIGAVALPAFPTRAISGPTCPPSYHTEQVERALYTLLCDTFDSRYVSHATIDDGGSLSYSIYGVTAL
ncbi:hypothetical protein [Cryobacterium sp. M91]|uniref:hypothetical protein n=1 Tax=Cryobacterium sp. M91 TaxID=2048294 RepID=UPI000CE2C642|nr:hypothetical protein [Cryobacterium sp. M91]